MKKLTTVLAGFLMCLSTFVFAEEHLSQSIKHTEAALSEGRAGKVPELVLHAKSALDHTLTASLAAKSISKNHIDAASKSLQDAIDHGNLNHAEAATKSVEEAANHLNAAKK